MMGREEVLTTVGNQLGLYTGGDMFVCKRKSRNMINTNKAKETISLH